MEKKSGMVVSVGRYAVWDRDFEEYKYLPETRFIRQALDNEWCIADRTLNVGIKMEGTPEYSKDKIHPDNVSSTKNKDIQK